MTTLEAALKYHSMGYHIIPCMVKDKRPLVEWKKYQDEPPSVDQIRSWWTKTPSANVAIVLGRGKFAVDLDGEGAGSLLEAKGIELPKDAPVSKTGSGYHVFLSAKTSIPDCVGLLSTNGGKPQIDIRGVGYVIAPPSIHPNGKHYEWIRPLSVDPPEAPAKLLDIIFSQRQETKTRRTAPKGNWLVEAIGGVSKGQRDVTCTRLVGYFLAKGVDVEATRALLLDSFCKNCDPPFGESDLDKVVDSIARRESLKGTVDRSLKPQPIEAVMIELEKDLDRPVSRTIKTPYGSLNKFLCGGFAAGELVYLGARPGVGKTSLALEIARRTASNGDSVLVISREMVTLSLARRILAQSARVSASALKSKNLNQFEVTRIREVVAKLKGLPLWITDEVISFREITEMVSGFKDGSLALLVVDYLQLIRAANEIKDRRLQVESVSQGLKALAVQFKMSVLCLSSLARPQDKKQRRPTLDMLRESGELEHDADIVILMHREMMAEETECIVVKNRDGRQGTAKLKFENEFVSFSNWIESP